MARALAAVATVLLVLSLLRPAASLYVLCPPGYPFVDFLTPRPPRPAPPSVTLYRPACSDCPQGRSSCEPNHPRAPAGSVACVLFDEDTRILYRQG
ncbi:hypothetical protein DFJ74DRAFT_672904 [Hyaloraphidium curvatum]|nr:hypothetical protein DFJ74DRAFT_672904 [Hyaloraphidium curvatum]